MRKILVVILFILLTALPANADLKCGRCLCTIAEHFYMCIGPFNCWIHPYNFCWWSEEGNRPGPTIEKAERLHHKAIFQFKKGA